MKIDGLSIDTTKTMELYHLRKDKLMSWYELANKYGITEREARKAYAIWQKHISAWKDFHELSQHREFMALGL